CAQGDDRPSRRGPGSGSSGGGGFAPLQPARHALPAPLAVTVEALREEPDGRCEQARLDLDAIRIQRLPVAPRADRNQVVPVPDEAIAFARLDLTRVVVHSLEGEDASPDGDGPQEKGAYQEYL